MYNSSVIHMMAARAKNSDKNGLKSKVPKKISGDHMMPQLTRMGKLIQNNMHCRISASRTKDPAYRRYVTIGYYDKVLSEEINL